MDGLRTGNTFVASGQLIDRLAFAACVGNRGPHGHNEVAAKALAIIAVLQNEDVDLKGCATMGEKLVVPLGSDIVVAIVVRDPSGTNYSPYTFDNPSLAQVGISQPLDAPVLDHIDVIRGLVTGYRAPGTPGYAGEWPRTWIQPYLSDAKPSLDSVPAAAKNTSAALVRSFNSAAWKSVPGKPEYKVMSFRVRDVDASQYLRLRGTNLPPSVPFETDADGNPLPDVFTNPAAINPSSQGGADGIPANNYLRIPCKVVGQSEFDDCPTHLPVVGETKYVAYDVAAWADLWFYSNPIYIQVNGSFTVAGVQ